MSHSNESRSNPKLDSDSAREHKNESLPPPRRQPNLSSSPINRSLQTHLDETKTKQNVLLPTQPATLYL
ncbi:hypothetical protein BDV28DRAFT_126817 [Aspergillus coremiiformis]|uniref:Uncharacterized protein n=1 Tax=Aspergillus coremiiformis TaxID=138285 RepID=A0A5N6ZK57_9EURO|nr:hypothetical protein BDV28DRAFT_126817 [Aspergillus coremiiformis]